MSAGAKDLVAKLLMVDASRRLSAREALRHPFVQRAKMMMAQQQVANTATEAAAGMMTG